jgi:large subunit ribosomal protein L25
MEIPDHIDVDISWMQIGDTLRLADLGAIEGVTYLDDPDETVIANVAAPRLQAELDELEAEAAEAEEAVEGEAAEAAAEGEEPQAGEAGEPSEE